MNDFNKNHPELREREIFLMNLFPIGQIPPEQSIADQYWRIRYHQSKRLGYTPYDPEGKQIIQGPGGEGPYPVFVLEEEYKDVNNFGSATIAERLLQKIQEQEEKI